MIEGCRPRAAYRQNLGRNAALCLALLCAGAEASALQAQTRPGDNNRAVQITQLVDELQQSSRLADAEKLLDVALAELRAGPEMTAVLHIRRAETRRVRKDIEGLEQDLQRAETLLAGTADEDLMLCNVHGIRGDAALDQGLLGVAARLFAQERRLIEQERAARGTEPIEWYHANVRACRLMMAREDYIDLEVAVSSWLDDPAYAPQQFTAQRAQLRLRLALGLREVEENDPSRALEAEAMLVDVLDQVMSGERPIALLRLAELGLRNNDLGGAQSWLDQAQEAMGSSIGDALQVEPLLLMALTARIQRLAGASAEGQAEQARALDELLDRFVAHWEQRPLREGGYGPLQFGPILALLGERIALHLDTGPGEEPLAAALSAIMHVSALGSLSRSLSASVPTLAQIREQVLGGSPDHGVLVYLPTPWTTHLFLLDTAHLRHFEIPRDDILEDARRRLARHLALPPAQQAPPLRSTLTAELGELLLPSAAWPTLQSWTRWSIVGTDVLGEVPFERLPAESGELVGTRFAVDRLPSLPVAVALAQRLNTRPSTGGVTLVVASDATQNERPPHRNEGLPGGKVVLLAANAPTPAALALSPGLPPLPLSRADAEVLLHGYAPEARVVLSGDDASFAALSESAAASSPRVWQIIAHGITNNSRELPTGLALAPSRDGHDGLLWVESARESTAPPLVILTACKAGAAPLRRGDPGAADLAGAFLQAGASAVIVSPYDLALGEVLQLSQVLHTALASGASPAEALRRTRVVMAASGDSTSETWTGLQVVGLGQLPLFSPPPKPGHSTWWLYGAPLALGIMVLVVSRRRRLRSLR